MRYFYAHLSLKIMNMMSFESLAYIILYLAAVAWVSYLPVLKTKQYDPPYFWRWAIMLTSSGPLLSGLTIIGFILTAQDASSYDSFIMTGWIILLLLIPFQLLIAMTAYLFICSTLKERRKNSLS